MVLVQRTTLNFLYSVHKKPAALQEQWAGVLDAINNALVLVNTHF